MDGPRESTNSYSSIFLFILLTMPKYFIFGHCELSEPSCRGLLLPPHRYHGFTSHHRFSQSGEMRKNWSIFFSERVVWLQRTKDVLFAITSVWTLGQTNNPNEFQLRVCKSGDDFAAGNTKKTKCLCKFAVVWGFSDILKDVKQCWKTIKAFLMSRQVSGANVSCI